MEEDFEFGSYDIVHESNEMSFGMMPHHLSCVLEDEPSLTIF